VFKKHFRQQSEGPWLADGTLAFTPASVDRWQAATRGRRWMGQPCDFVAEDASNCQGNTVGGALEFFAPKYGALIGANISS